MFVSRNGARRAKKGARRKKHKPKLRGRRRNVDLAYRRAAAAW
jgi:hypothetical protein